MHTDFFVHAKFPIFLLNRAVRVYFEPYVMAFNKNIFFPKKGTHCCGAPNVKLSIYFDFNKYSEVYFEKLAQTNPNLP